MSPASLGLGASLVLLLSKSAAELNRMAELRAQMERLVLDTKEEEEARSSNHPNASDDHADITKEEPTAFSGGALSRCSRTAAAPGNAGHHAAVPMDQMEAELEAELTLLQCATPRRDRQLEVEQLEAHRFGSISPPFSNIYFLQSIFADRRRRGGVHGHPRGHLRRRRR